MVIEVREAPVPVRWRWSEIGGQPMVVCWFHDDPAPIARYTKAGDAMTVELSNGQKIIVRAKK